MIAEIISTGSELVAGAVLDTNATWLSQRLAESGITVSRHTTLGDDRSGLVEEIRQAADRTDVVVITGGLGPTPDDVTRDALADVMGVPLREDAAALDKLRELFRRVGRDMPDSNRVQVMIPRGAELIDNPCGTAPGISARVGDARVYALPGVPREMQRMFADSVALALASVQPGTVMATEVCHSFGLAEAGVGEALADLMEAGRNPTVGITAREGIISARVTARGADRAAARALALDTVAVVRQRLGTRVFGTGTDTLPSVVAGLLRRHGATIATAESCTGGLLAKLLTDLPGSSDYFVEGAVTYANAAKTARLGVPEGLLHREGAVSEAAAAAMAEGCRRRADTDYALSVSGIAGPTGGSPDKPVGLVYIGLAEDSGCTVHERRFGSHHGRELIRLFSCHHALDLLRRRLLDYEKNA